MAVPIAAPAIAPAVVTVFARYPSQATATFSAAAGSSQGHAAAVKARTDLR